MRNAEVGVGSAHPPRLHDLRHTFAVATLVHCYRTGQDVTAKMPLLSTYLGHRDPRSTYWYLSAAPELLALAAGRIEAAAGEVNCLSAAIPSRERVVTCEEVFELTKQALVHTSVRH